MLSFSGLVMYITIYTIVIFLVCNYLNTMFIMGFIVLLILFGLVLKIYGRLYWRGIKWQKDK
jgi:hypothetical protein